MLHRIGHLIGFPIEATDASIGKIKDCLFDDQLWLLRYFVVDTGSWLSSHKTLVTPSHLEDAAARWHGDRLHTTLTKEQIENLPPLDDNAPVSRQYETEYARYFQYQPYWEGSYAVNAVGQPLYPPIGLGSGPVGEGNPVEARESKIEDCHLRSAKETISYSVSAKDGSIGKIDDFIVDDSTWQIRYLTIDTRKWLPGRTVVTHIDWLRDLNWAQSEATVHLSKEVIRTAPKFEPDRPIDEAFEETLLDHYGKPPVDLHLRAPPGATRK